MRSQFGLPAALALAIAARAPAQDVASKWGPGGSTTLGFACNGASQAIFLRDLGAPEGP
jgi:hypothetical protein